MTNKKCHIKPNKIRFRNIKYITRINISATRRYTCILLHHAYFIFYLKTGASVLTLYLYIQKQIINSLKHFHPSLICNALMFKYFQHKYVSLIIIVLALLALCMYVLFYSSIPQILVLLLL